MTVSDLTRGAEYSFIVSGMDGGGRVGEESLPSDVVTFDSKALRKQHPMKSLFISLEISQLSFHFPVLVCTLLQCYLAKGSLKTVDWTTGLDYWTMWERNNKPADFICRLVGLKFKFFQV